MKIQQSDRLIQFAVIDKNVAIGFVGFVRMAGIANREYLTVRVAAVDQGPSANLTLEPNDVQALKEWFTEIT